MPRSHRTQIAYFEWNIPGKYGRVRRFQGGFDLWASRWDVLNWWFGVRGHKVIHDEQVSVIRTFPHVVIIEFDDDDELLIRDEVMRDIEPTARLVIRPGLDGSSARRLSDLRARQRDRGDCSWSDGRRAGSPILSTRQIRLRKAIPPVVVCVAIVASLLTRVGL